MSVSLGLMNLHHSYTQPLSILSFPNYHRPSPDLNVKTDFVLVSMENHNELHGNVTKIQSDINSDLRHYMPINFDHIPVMLPRNP